ncbi:MAG: hypothetical protein ACRDVP_07130, partial [Acidimicrobiales bacterium]
LMESVPLYVEVLAQGEKDDALRAASEAADGQLEPPDQAEFGPDGQGGRPNTGFDANGGNS